MAETDEKGVSIEVLGTCITNTTADSQHDAKVEYRHLWSYAQQAALIAVSDNNTQDGCYHLITDPERRAKRIAAHYAFLYFESARKSKGKVQFYWPALAAFVVKDIVEAYRFTREEVLQRQWKDLASVARNSSVADLGSLVMTSDSPYQHALRTYAALAKGNLWLFMDIYPWLWFFLQYGITPDGTLNTKRLAACLPERNWETYQHASKKAIEELPYGPPWMARLAGRLESDPVYKTAGGYLKEPTLWSPDGGYGQHGAVAYRAHHYCRAHVKDFDHGYRMPFSGYWGKFQEAYYVMESEHIELGRMVKDAGALAALVKLRFFTTTNAVSETYHQLINEFSAPNKAKKAEIQFRELVAVAEQEQINVLQPLIYNDPLLKATMDTNHKFSRMTNGWLSPKFKVIYSAGAMNNDPALETVFDAPTGIAERFFGERKSLPNAADRMEFVENIAKQFNHLMQTRRDYMEAELHKIRTWMAA